MSSGLSLFGMLINNTNHTVASSHNIRFNQPETKMNAQYQFWFSAAMMQEAAGTKEQAEKFFAMAMLYAKS